MSPLKTHYLKVDNQFHCIQNKMQHYYQHSPNYLITMGYYQQYYCYYYQLHPYSKVFYSYCYLCESSRDFQDYPSSRYSTHWNLSQEDFDIPILEFYFLCCYPTYIALLCHFLNYILFENHMDFHQS